MEMNDIVFVLGWHKEYDTKLPIEDRVPCALCDKPVEISGYGTDSSTGQTYKMPEKKKVIALECAINLTKHVAQALTDVEELRERMRK